MESWQRNIILVCLFLNLAVFVKGYYECKFRKNAYKLTPNLGLLGIFAWGDAVVFGLFWMLVSLTSYLLRDWTLFLLIVSVFWVVRSLGETICWINQQYSTINRNPPNKLHFYSIFQNDSVWYVFQILWQCVTVVSIIFSLYFGKVWIDSRF